MQIEKKAEFTGHSGSVFTLASFQDKIYSGSEDGFVSRWDLNSQMQDTFSINVGEPIYSIFLLASKNQLLIGTKSGSMHVIDLLENKELHNFVVHKSTIFTFQILAKENLIIVGDSEGNLTIWDYIDWKLKLTIPLNSGKIRSICFSPSNESMYVACQNGKIYCFETEWFNQIAVWDAHPLGVNIVGFNPEKPNVLISGGKDGYLRFWNIKDSYKEVVKIPAHNYAIYGMAFFSTRNVFITVSRDKSIKCWGAFSLDVVCKLTTKQRSHTHSINTIVKTSENEFVTSGDDKRIIVWRIV